MIFWAVAGGWALGIALLVRWMRVVGLRSRLEERIDADLAKQLQKSALPLAPSHSSSTAGQAKAVPADQAHLPVERGPMRPVQATPRV